MNAAELEESIRSGKQFVWIKQRVFSHEKQAVQDLGLTGLVFRERPVRVYPLGNLLSHVVGGVRTNRVENWGAEIVGVGGAELYFEPDLREGGAPITLSIDRRAQSVLHDALKSGIERNQAKGGSAVLMDVATGEIYGLASFPDYDPNNRPLPLDEGLSDDDPLLNRSAQGVYELGSVMKPITAALAIDRGDATLDTPYDVGNALLIGRRTIREHYIRDHTISLLEVVQRSSNVGSALAALAIGGTGQKAFLRELGLLEELPIEISEARGSHPIYPARWKADTTATVAYGPRAGDHTRAPRKRDLDPDWRRQAGAAYPRSGWKRGQGASRSRFEGHGGCDAGCLTKCGSDPARNRQTGGCSRIRCRRQDGDGGQAYPKRYRLQRRQGDCHLRVGLSDARSQIHARRFIG